MIKTLILVACGGAIGASLRHLWGIAFYRVAGGPADFPTAIIAANILGSFLMGAFVVLAAQRGLTHYGPFVMTGLLGGFTTFSAFSLEAVRLMERGEMGHFAMYVVMSVGLSILGLMLGLWVMRGVLT